MAVARLYEQSGKPAEAEQQYLLALKEKPDYLPALLGYAQLKERLGQPDDAIAALPACGQGVSAGTVGV